MKCPFQVIRKEEKRRETLIITEKWLQCHEEKCFYYDKEKNTCKKIKL